MSEQGAVPDQEPAEQTSAEQAPAARTPAQLSRRKLMLGTGIGALAGLAGFAAGAVTGPTVLGGGAVAAPEPDGEPSASQADSAASGATQAGVARPATPQRSALFVVADLPLDGLDTTLARLGDAVLALTETPDPTLLPDGAGDLTILVGLGPRALTALPKGAELRETLTLPSFAGDNTLDPRFLGGDLLLCLASSDPGALDPAFSALAAELPGLQIRWSDRGFRGPGDDGIARNPFGFHDGIIVPRGEAELNKNVWIPDGPLAGGTVCDIRRFALDTTAFHALSATAQSAVFGRDKVSGIPLSGGKLRDEGNIVQKTEAGEFVIPADAHLRAAHPSFTGSDLMLRRSYSFASAPLDGSAPGITQQGLLFMSFQKDVRTFVRTQQRMDEMDALMRFAHPTATAAFAILPGFSSKRPLGATIA